MVSKSLSFESLPAEIISQVLTLLPPLSLVNLSGTSRLLRSHSQNDLLWARFVQESVPKCRTWLSPFPCDSWKELYISHHPYWFLPRRKIWFSDRSHTGSTMTGQVIIARYDSRRGCIEAYRLVTEHGDHHFEPWERDSEVIIHTFNPKVTLWLDDPVIKLDLGWHRGQNSSQREILMRTGGAVDIRSSIALCQAIPVSLQNPSMALWPPAIIPATQRVRNESQSKFRSPGHRPRSLAEASDSTFRIRKWLEFRGGKARLGEDVMTFSTLLEESYTPTKQKPWQGIWVGDYSGHGCEFLVVIQKDVNCGQPAIRASRWSSQSSLTTLASTESVNGTSDVTACETPSPTIETAANDEDAASEEEPSGPPEDGSCWGRLEAIKLTGDPNVPRGEYTWIAEDIGPKGLLRVATEQMFKGARVVRSLGHSAAREFRDGRWHSVMMNDMRQVLIFDRSIHSVATDHDLS